MDAGLGERKISFTDIDCQPKEYRDRIIEEFPKLKQGGGFELMRCVGNSRILEPISSAALLSLHATQERVGWSKVYIRPIQADLDVTSLKTDIIETQTLFEECKWCHNHISISSLKDHIQMCSRRCSKDVETVAYVNLTSDSDESKEQFPLIDIKTSSSIVENVELDDDFLPVPLSRVKKSSYQAYLEMVDERESDDDQNVFIQTAISESLQDINDCAPASDSHDVADILKTHSIFNVSTSESSRVKVRRTHIWSDSVKVFRRIDLSKMLKVTFIGEAAIDDGGLRREYLRLMMAAMSKQNDLLDGPNNCRVLRHNVLASQKGHFYIMGYFIVLSLTQGGPPPAFFAPSVIDYLVGRSSKASPVIDDIPDYEVQEKLKKLNSVTDEEEFCKILASQDFTFRFDCGLCQPASAFSLRDKDSIISSISMHYCIYACKAELDELKRGLDSIGFLDVLIKYPVLWSLFRHSPSKLTAEAVEDMFLPMFSPIGSNNRAKEEAVMMWFSGDKHGDLVVLEDEQEKRLSLFLEDILVFATGAECPPPMGWSERPKIEFKDGTDLPSSSTCSNCLYLPTMNHENYDLFKYKFVFGINCAVGFGQV